MRIGARSFRGLRLTTDVSDEVRRHSSQFLGTGVIRAHQAESCGLKGLRIFIHPDSEMNEDWQSEMCEVEVDPPQSNRIERRVTHELNYIEHHPDFKPDGPQTTDESYIELVAGVTKVMNRSPVQEKLHYHQTFAALSRMRDAYSRPGPK